nr:siderophore ABC transporter substrate-binding protein [Hoeflea olei]
MMSRLHTPSRRRVVAALALGAALALAPAAARADTVEVAHARGTTAIEAAPEKVFVFDLPALDTLDALGVKVSGVPSGVKPAYLETYNSGDYLKIGSLFEPDFEEIAAAAPDLIISGERMAEQYGELSRIAPTIEMKTDYTDFLASAERTNRTLASVFGKQADADAMIARFEASASAVKAKAEHAGKALIILTTGGRISAYGPGSRFGIIHTDFGIRPAAPDLEVATHGQAISYEFILKTDPDYLFVIDRDAAIGRSGKSAQALLDNDLVNQTKAARSGRIVYLQADAWYLSGTGLTALQTMVDELAAALDRSE